jgi:hypothetical protein
MTNFIYELEYEECLGAVKKALLITGDDDYVNNVECSGYDKSRKDTLAREYVVDKLDGYANLKANDPYTYDNELREYHCGVVNDSDFDIRKTAYSYDAAIDEDLHTKKDCILDYVTNEFGFHGARYTDIIKLAYYLGAHNGPIYTSANRGYYSGALDPNRKTNGHLIKGGKDCLVKGINKENNERYFALSFVESATDYWKYVDDRIESGYKLDHPLPCDQIDSAELDNFRKVERNSVQSIVDVLDNYLLLPESEIHRRAFGFDRSTSYGNNKKYADMLRRGLKKGLYKRMQFDKGFSKQFPQSEYFYYTNKLC